jgi:hypothetical protein
MPYTIRKVQNKPCFKVYNKKTKRVYSKCSSKKNAQSQLRLLRAIEYNKDFVPRSSGISRRNREMNRRTKKIR